MTAESVGDGSQHPFTPRHDFHYKLRYFSKLHNPQPTKQGSQTYRRASPAPHQNHHKHHQFPTKTKSVTPPFGTSTSSSSSPAAPYLVSSQVSSITDKPNRRRHYKKRYSCTKQAQKHSARASRPIRIPSRLSPAEEQEAAQLRGSRLRCRLRPRHVPMAIVKAGEAVAAACTRPESSLRVPDLPPSPSCEPWLWADDAMTVTVPFYDSSSTSSSSPLSTPSSSSSSSYPLSATASGSEDSGITSSEDDDEDLEDDEEEGKDEMDQGDEELEMGFDLEM